MKRFRPLIVTAATLVCLAHIAQPALARDKAIASYRLGPTSSHRVGHLAGEYGVAAWSVRSAKSTWVVVRSVRGNLKQRRYVGVDVASVRVVRAAEPGSSPKVRIAVTTCTQADRTICRLPPSSLVVGPPGADRYTQVVASGCRAFALRTDRLRLKGFRKRQNVIRVVGVQRLRLDEQRCAGQKQRATGYRATRAQ